MIKLNCHFCNKEMIIQTIVGTTPLNAPIHNFCSEECVTKSQEKSSNTSES